MKLVHIYSHLRQVDPSLCEKDEADHEAWHEGDEQAGAMPENTRRTGGETGGGTGDGGMTRRNIEFIDQNGGGAGIRLRAQHN